MGNWGKRVHFPQDGHAADFSVWHTSVLLGTDQVVPVHMF